MNAATIGTATIELRDASKQIVAAVVSYSANVATLNPTPTLAAQATHTVVVAWRRKRRQGCGGNALAPT